MSLDGLSKAGALASKVILCCSWGETEPSRYRLYQIAGLVGGLVKPAARISSSAAGGVVRHAALQVFVGLPCAAHANPSFFPMTAARIGEAG